MMEKSSSSVKKNQLRLVIQIIALIAVGLFLGYNLYLWNMQSMKGDMLPMPLGVGAAVVLSGSMEPELSVDDVIFVAVRHTYEVDDVVVYQSGNTLVVHKIIRMEDGMVITKGTANNTEDAPVSPDAIKGLVIGHADGLGRVIRLLKTPTVYITLMGLVFYLINRSFQKDKQQEEDEVAKLEEEIRRLKQQQE